MNFLIISLARCGSSSLLKSISNSYCLKEIFEPYASWGLQRRKYELSNVVVKTIFHQINNIEYRLGNLPLSHFEKCLKFYLNLSKKFDKTILLSRKNRKEQAESLYSLYSGTPYNSKYVYEFENDICEIINQLECEHSYLEKLSNEINIPIDTYEEVYYGKGLNDKSIILDYTILDTKYKLRQIVSTKAIL